MKVFLAEMIGTLIFVFLTQSAFIQIKNDINSISSKIFISFSFAAVWTFVSYIFGTTSGAHFDIAISVALALDGSLKISLLPTYILAQLIGAIIGCIIFLIIFSKEIYSYSMGDVSSLVSNQPKKESIVSYALKEFFAAFLLLFGIKAVKMIWGLVGGLNYFYMFIIILTLGLTLVNWNTLSVNPIRDIPCKIVLLIYSLITKKEIEIKWIYSIVALIAVLLGSIAAVYANFYFPWPVLR